MRLKSTTLRCAHENTPRIGECFVSLPGVLAAVAAERRRRWTIVDPSIHAGDVIVADSVDDHKLEKDGAFRMVSTEEKRPAGWVRNLASITVIEARP